VCVCVCVCGPTFHEQRHERNHGHAQFADRETVDSVIARRIHHRLEVRVHLAELAWQFLSARHDHTTSNELAHINNIRKTPLQGLGQKCRQNASR